MHSQCCRYDESSTVTEISALFYFILDSSAQSLLPWCTVYYFLYSEFAQLHSTSGNFYGISVLFQCVLLTFIPFCTTCVPVIPFLITSMTPTCDLTLSGCATCDRSCVLIDLI